MPDFRRTSISIQMYSHTTFTSLASTELSWSKHLGNWIFFCSSESRSYLLVIDINIYVLRSSRQWYFLVFTRSDQNVSELEMLKNQQYLSNSAFNLFRNSHFLKPYTFSSVSAFDGSILGIVFFFNREHLPHHIPIRLEISSLSRDIWYLKI